MPRSVSEWIGKTDDARVPPRVRRKARHAPLTIQYFEERSSPEPNSGCWLWLGAIQRNGYGVIRFGGSNRRAHRACWEVAHGVTLSRQIDVCHRCDTRSCVNPDHLFAGTRVENMQDCIRKGRFSPIPVLSGEASPSARLSEADVLAIRADSRSQRVIAAAFGVDKGTIAHIKHRKTWRQI